MESINSWIECKWYLLLEAYEDLQDLLELTPPPKDNYVNVPQMLFFASIIKSLLG